METSNYWKQFESTGKIEDYLSYRANDSQQSGEGLAGCKSDYRGTARDGAQTRGTDGRLCRDSYR
ncbi:MAG: hypothetical protein NC399_04515 [Muribaculum sp.]|nr:hypothetical protein [Muribaculum sp.]